MNKDERTHFENMINSLISTNKEMLRESEIKFKVALTTFHNQEIRQAQEAKRLEAKLDVYCQQLYRNSFYGGIAWRFHTVAEWLKRKSNLRQKPVLKKLEVGGA